MNTSRLKALGSWLVEAWTVWVTLALILVALAVSLRRHTPEPVIRLTGLVLQLLGIGTVVWGISETRALFGHPSFARKAHAWLGRFPLLRRHIVLGAATATASAMVGNVRAHVTQTPGENPTVEARLDALEENVTLIHERITKTQREIDEHSHKTAEALTREAQSRQAEDNAIREKLEATGTGGVHISLMGASWLFVGVILSTAAPEIAEWLK